MYLQANNNGIEIPFDKWIVKLLDIHMNLFEQLIIKYSCAGTSWCAWWIKGLFCL